jgi:cytochrome c oxidase assembly protein subunit 11
MMALKTERESLERRHARVAYALTLLVGVMVGAAYAAVPLYDLICRATGLGGTTQRAAVAPDRVLADQIRVRLDGTVASGLPWSFRPTQSGVDVRLGENVLAFFEATNTSDRPVVGTARFNVTPEVAGRYFNKIECFCFTEQRLEPGQRVEMPVSFFIDPEILKDPEASWLKEITLSYVFFRVPDQAVKVSSEKSENGGPKEPTVR